jgi:transposase
MPIVEKMYNEGRPVKEIAKMCGNSMSTVYKALDRLEAQGRVKRRKGHYKRHRRLTQEEIEFIKKLYLEGASIYEIAKRLERPESTIYYALKRLGLKK